MTLLIIKLTSQRDQNKTLQFFNGIESLNTMDQSWINQNGTK